MTSVYGTLRTATSLPTPGGGSFLAYESTTGFYLPVPFDYDKRTQTITVKTVNNFDPTTSNNQINRFFAYAGSQQGTMAQHLVLGLSDDFKTWISTWRNADAGSIRIHENGVIQKVILQTPIDGTLNLNFYETTKPQSYESAYGPGPSFYTTYAFAKPLIIKYTVSGVQKYLSLVTNFNELL